MTMRTHRRRHLLLAAGGAAVLAGCAMPALEELQTPAEPEPRAGGEVQLRPWRTIQGGYLSPAAAPGRRAAAPGSGVYVRLHAPTALALRGNDLLVVDSGAARTYRYDLGVNALVPITGAPSVPGTAVALGPDLSAWVLDRMARQVLRFASDGRLLQTFRAIDAAPAPIAFALADGGARLLVADAALAQVVEFRPLGATRLPIIPRDDASVRVPSVAGLAVGRDGLFVLDRQSGRVHRLDAQGRVIESLGVGELGRPVMLAVDRHDRLFVVDAEDRMLKVLRTGGAVQRFSAAQLGVQQIDGIALDEGVLAVADGTVGQVVLHLIHEGGGR